MSGFEFPEAPEIETAYRTAYEALRAIASRPSIDPGHDLTVSELIRQFGRVTEEAELTVAAQIGPLVSWRGPMPQRGTLEPVSAVVDLDGGDYSSDDVRLGQDAYEGIDGTWHGSALDHAGRAYKRECGWDFPPGRRRSLGAHAGPGPMRRGRGPPMVIHRAHHRLRDPVRSRRRRLLRGGQPPLDGVEMETQGNSKAAPGGSQVAVRVHRDRGTVQPRR